MAERRRRRSPGRAETGLVIRPPAGPDELDRLVGIQREVWVGDDLDLTPPSLFRASIHGGGILLGAFVGSSPAGFVFSFPAEHEGRRCQHSHQLAVRPDFRGRGLGKALKWAQREAALRRGIDLIIWTFEPLLARNANLNLAVLGAAARTYLPDFYGSRPALVLAPGVPTDRLLVEWELLDPRVAGKAESAGAWMRRASDESEGDRMVSWATVGTSKIHPFRARPRPGPASNGMTGGGWSTLSMPPAGFPDKPSGASAKAPGIGKRSTRTGGHAEAGLGWERLPKALKRRPESGAAPLFVRPGSVNLSLTDEVIAAEVPPDIAALRPRPDLIAGWQSALRRVFIHYFAAGYEVVRFISGDRCFYVLERF